MNTVNSKEIDSILSGDLSKDGVDKGDLSLSTLEALFWMLEESETTTLEQQSAKILKRHFGNLEAAHQYRSEKEAEQFMLSHIFDQQPMLKILPA